MKRKMLVALLVLAVALGALGCDRDVIRGSGKVVEEDRSVSGFSGVHLAGIGTITIHLGDQEALRIEAEDNLLKYFETEVRSGMLWIEQDEDTTLRPKQPVNFFLTAKALDAISVSGSGEIKAPPLSAERFAASVSGSGDVAIRSLDAGSLEARVSGSGEIDIAGGKAETQEVTISGSGEYNSRDMESGIAKVVISGSGAATVWVRDELRVDISGSGDLRYAGNPTLHSDVSGSGDIDRIGE